MTFDPSTATEFDPSSAVEVTAGFDPSSAAEIPVEAPKLTTMQQFQADARADQTKRKTAPVIGPVGQIEGGINMLSSMGASAVGGLAGIVGAILPGPQGQGADWAHRIQSAGTYQPRSESGKLASESLAAPMSTATDLSKYLFGKVGSVLGNENAGEFAGEVAPSIVASIFGIKAPVKSIATTPYKGTGLSMPTPLANARASAERKYAPIIEDKAQAASAADWQRSNMIESAQTARSLPVPINLKSSVSNPTIRNKIDATIAGNSALDSALSKSNRYSWGNNAKADMGGIHVDVPLDITRGLPAIEAYRAKQAAPYKAVANLGTLTPDAATLSSIKNLKIPDLISDPAATGMVQGLIDRTLGKFDNGMTGAQALEHIKQLRSDADATLKAKAMGNKMSPSALAEADASLAIASSIEDAIANTVPRNQTGLISALKEGRKNIAKSYAYQKAIDFDTGVLNPLALPPTMTGIGQQMRQVAANHPYASDVSAVRGSVSQPHLTRSGVGGTIGASIGSTLLPGVGTVAGGAIGAGAADLAGMMKARKMLTPEYQSSRVVPKDRRIQYVDPPVVEQPILSIGADGYTPPTPFRESGAVAPDFVLKPNRQLNEVPQIGLSKGPVEGQPKGLNPLTPSDVTNKLSFPNDKVKAEYVRLQREMAVNQAKQEALAASANRNVNSMFDNMGPQDLSKQGGALKNIMEQKKLEMENAALIDKMNELTDKYGKNRPSSRGYTQGDKTHKFQRGMLTGEPK